MYDAFFLLKVSTLVLISICLLFIHSGMFCYLIQTTASRQYPCHSWSSRSTGWQLTNISDVVHIIIFIVFIVVIFFSIIWITVSTSTFIILVSCYIDKYYFFLLKLSTWVFISFVPIIQTRFVFLFELPRVDGVRAVLGLGDRRAGSLPMSSTSSTSLSLSCLLSSCSFSSSGSLFSVW